MPSLVYLPMNFRIYMSRVYVYGWTSAWIKSPPRTWSSIPASAARLGRSNNEAWSWSVWLFWGRQLFSHDQLVCHPPHTSASTIGMIIQMGMSIRLICKSQHCIARKGKCFDCLSTIGLWREDGQLVKSSNIALDKEWPQKTFIWPHSGQPPTSRQGTLVIRRSEKGAKNFASNSRRQLSWQPSYCLLCETLPTSVKPAHSLMALLHSLPSTSPFLLLFLGTQ